MHLHAAEDGERSVQKLAAGSGRDHRGAVAKRKQWLGEGGADVCDLAPQGPLQGSQYVSPTIDDKHEH